MNSDVWMTILQETDVKTVGRMASVSKQLSLISERDEIWFQFAKLKFTEIGSDRSHQRAWKIKYKNFKPKMYLEHGDAYNHIICEDCTYKSTYSHKCFPNSYWNEIQHQGVKNQIPNAIAHSIRNKKEFHVLVLGSRNVGKKSFCWPPEFLPNLKGDNVTDENQVLRINCFVGDRAKGEFPLDKNCRYVSLSIDFSRKRHYDACICMFKVTNLDTFQDIENNYLNQFKDIKIKMLVGTHIDEDPRTFEVSYQNGLDLSTKLGMSYFEVQSYQTGGARSQIFVEIARKIIEKEDVANELNAYAPKPYYPVTSNSHGRHGPRVAPCTIQ